MRCRSALRWSIFSSYHFARFWPARNSKHPPTTSLWMLIHPGRLKASPNLNNWIDFDIYYIQKIINIGSANVCEILFMIHHSIEVHRSSIDKHFQLAFTPHHPTTALHPAMRSVYEPELSLPQSNEAFFFTASAMASRSASSRRRWRSTLISWQLRSSGALLIKKLDTLLRLMGKNPDDSWWSVD